ncbi:MAG: LytTR family DNA-binding domain-containing protein [Eubacteriales bacterium]|nr:LytTR family DNA-binding domain-containing protein [Eubacteriales bacterium]
MIRIAICDDNREDIDRLNKYITGYFSRTEDYASEICCFDSARALLGAMGEKPFDIYFLDILLPEQNGMEIGRFIRKVDQEAVIVYITVSLDFAFEAFGVRAFQYLQKPVDKVELSDTLERILRLTEKKRNSKMCVRTKEGLVSISIPDIMYVENVSRCTVYVMKDGGQVTGVCNRGSFEKSVSFLNRQSGFIQPHKSYFVNMHYIHTFGTKSLSLDDGTQIAISRKRFAETKKAYLEFLEDGGMI